METLSLSVFLSHTIYKFLHSLSSQPTQKKINRRHKTRELLLVPPQLLPLPLYHHPFSLLFIITVIIALRSRCNSLLCILQLWLLYCDFRPFVVGEEDCVLRGASSCGGEHYKRERKKEYRKQPNKRRSSFSFVLFGNCNEKRPDIINNCRVAVTTLVGLVAKLSKKNNLLNLKKMNIMSILNIVSDEKREVVWKAFRLQKSFSRFFSFLNCSQLPTIAFSYLPCLIVFFYRRS